MQIKSRNVEDAVLEVIDLLCGNISNINTENKLHIQRSNTDLDFDNDESDGLIELFHRIFYFHL